MPTVRANRFLPALKRVVLVREIADKKRRSSTCFGNFRGGPRQFFFRARRQKYRRSFLGKQLRHGAANPASRSGNQRRLVHEQHLFTPVPR